MDSLVHLNDVSPRKRENENRNTGKFCLSTDFAIKISWERLFELQESVFEKSRKKVVQKQKFGSAKTKSESGARGLWRLR